MNYWKLGSLVFIHIFACFFQTMQPLPRGNFSSQVFIHKYKFLIFLSIFVTETRRAHGINPRTEAQLFLLLKGRFFNHSGWFCRHEWLCMIPGSRIFNVDNPRRNLEFKVLWIFSWDIGSRQICGNARCNLKNCSGRVQNRVGEMKFWGHLGVWGFFVVVFSGHWFKTVLWKCTVQRCSGRVQNRDVWDEILESEVLWLLFSRALVPTDLRKCAVHLGELFR